ncbi:MAG: hypothetical protein ACJAV9_001292 [Urechidicola sp.]|jgi:hypothetical protein
MSSLFTTLAVFDYTIEAKLVKSKLDSEGIRTQLLDEKTIDSDPLISQTIRVVKLQVHNEDVDKALKIYNDIREYKTFKNGDEIHCPKCNSTRILDVSAKRKNIFYMLFPFFEKSRSICNDCKTVF